MSKPQKHFSDLMTTPGGYIVIYFIYHIFSCKIIYLFILFLDFLDRQTDACMDKQTDKPTCRSSDFQSLKDPVFSILYFDYI